MLQCRAPPPPPPKKNQNLTAAMTMMRVSGKEKLDDLQICMSSSLFVYVMHQQKQQVETFLHSILLNCCRRGKHRRVNSTIFYIKNVSDNRMTVHTTNKQKYMIVWNEETCWWCCICLHSNRKKKPECLRKFPKCQVPCWKDAVRWFKCGS